MAEMKFVPSAVEQEIYPEGEKEQLAALERSGQLNAYRLYRERVRDERFNPIYHFYSPDGRINDPNGLCFWKGKCHLFYQAFPKADDRAHWGHTYSEDMVHWRDLPLAIYPTGKEHAVYSGSSLVEEDRTIAIYHGRFAGTMIATASDPMLLCWHKSEANPVIPSLPDQNERGGRPYSIFDPFIWKEETGYYCLSGCLYGDLEKRGRCDSNEMVEHLFHSQDLEHWAYMGELAPGGFPHIPRGNDGACPYFWPLGSKHVLFTFSHRSGAYVTLGDYDPITHRFHPIRTHQFNHGPLSSSSYQAPCATPDGHGGLYFILNAKDANPTLERQGMMGVMYHMWLDENEDIRMKPVDALASLHSDAFEEANVRLEAFQKHVPQFDGDALDLQFSLARGTARAIRMRVLTDPQEREHTDVVIHMPIPRTPDIAFLTIDTTYSSLSEGLTGRMPESTEFRLDADEPINVRILVDKCSVEVFVNDRVVLMQIVYPTLDTSRMIDATAIGGHAEITALKGWRMKSIYGG